MKKSSWKFIGIESLFLLVMVLAISLCSYIQYLGMIDTGRGCGGIFGGSIYQFNPIAYVLGLGLYVVAFILCNKYILSKCMELMPDTKIWAKIFYFVLMGVFGFLGFMGVMYVYLMVFGLAGTVEDTVLELITWFGWPAALLIVMVVRFIINCVKTQPELVMEAVDKPLVDDSIVELDEIMEGIDYIKKPEAETEEETKEEAEAQEDTETKVELETKEETEAKVEEETKEEAEATEETETKVEAEDKEETEANAEEETKVEAEVKEETETKVEAEAKEETEAKVEEETKEEAEVKAEEEVKEEIDTKKDSEDSKEEDTKEADKE